MESDNTNWLGSDSDDEDTKAMFEKYRAKNQIGSRATENTCRKIESDFGLKPTDIDVKLDQLESRVRQLLLDGVTWLGCTTIDLAYGIKVLRIICQLKDDKTDPDTIREEIEKDQHVQSTDVVTFTMA